MEFRHLAAPSLAVTMTFGFTTQKVGHVIKFWAPPLPNTKSFWTQRFFQHVPDLIRSLRDRRWEKIYFRIFLTFVCRRLVNFQLKMLGMRDGSAQLGFKFFSIFIIFSQIELVWKSLKLSRINSKPKIRRSGKMVSESSHAPTTEGRWSPDNLFWAIWGIRRFQ